MFKRLLRRKVIVTAHNDPYKTVHDSPWLTISKLNELTETVNHVLSIVKDQVDQISRLESKIELLTDLLLSFQKDHQDGLKEVGDSKDLLVSQNNTNNLLVYRLLDMLSGRHAVEPAPCETAPNSPAAQASTITPPMSDATRLYLERKAAGNHAHASPKLRLP